MKPEAAVPTDPAAVPATSGAGGSDPTAESAAVGRGGLAITFAKAYFILQGLVQQVLLPRVLGLDGYGALSSVLSAASITYNPITTMSIQAMSRTVVQAPPAELHATVRRVLRWHALFGLLLAALFAVAA